MICCRNCCCIVSEALRCQEEGPRSLLRNWKISDRWNQCCNICCFIIQELPELSNNIKTAIADESFFKIFQHQICHFRQKNQLIKPSLWDGMVGKIVAYCTSDKFRLRLEADRSKGKRMHDRGETPWETQPLSYLLPLMSDQITQNATYGYTLVRADWHTDSTGELKKNPEIWFTVSLL